MQEQNLPKNLDLLAQKLKGDLDRRRLARLKAACDQKEGISAEALADMRERLVGWIDEARGALSGGQSLADAE